MNCPTCGSTRTLFETAGGKIEAGSFTVCLNCHQICQNMAEPPGISVAGIKLRAVTDDELGAYNPEMVAGLLWVKEMAIALKKRESITEHQTSGQGKMTNDELETFLIGQGYLYVREIPERGWCGIQIMFLQTGLFYGMDKDGSKGHYYYERLIDAKEAIRKWDGTGDPSGPWTFQKEAQLRRANPNNKTDE